MTTIKSFSRFAKGGTKALQKKNTCVIYTRVSTKEQADNNMSLDIQRKACESYVKKNSYLIMAYFGGTYESAKTDERKEFNNMLSFVKKSREQISFIIVYSVDRFSRSGGNAIYITEQLQKEGINVVAVTQPTDASTPSGILQQNIQFIFSQYDNQLRKEKAVAGMKNKLLMGEWCVKPPMGYDIIKINGKKSIIANADGALIRKAFLWKYYERLPMVEILHRLKAMGLEISKTHIGKVLRNPFYCGIISHKMLEGKIVKGKHEKIISSELFLAVNSMLTTSKLEKYRYKEYIEIPLKRILICEKCGKRMTGYCVRSKNLFYYKCPTAGCKSNKNASQLHTLFIEELRKREINEKSYLALKNELAGNFIQLNNINHKSCNHYLGLIGKLKKKIKITEERFVLGDIKEDLYKKHTGNFRHQISDIEKEIDKVQAGLIERKKIKEEAEKQVTNLTTMWQAGNLQIKRMIQSTVFPQGIFYSKEADTLLEKQQDYVNSNRS